MKRTKPTKPPAEKTRMQIGSLIDSALYRQAGALARNAGELIDEALRDYLAKHGAKLNHRPT